MVLETVKSNVWKSDTFFPPYMASMLPNGEIDWATVVVMMVRVVKNCLVNALMFVEQYRFFTFS